VTPPAGRMPVHRNSMRPNEIVLIIRRGRLTMPCFMCLSRTYRGLPRSAARCPAETALPGVSRW
jgi:hypothetical protein